MQFSWKDAALPDAFFESVSGKLEARRKGLSAALSQGRYDAPESALNLVSDTSVLQVVRESVRTLVTPELKYVVLVGIGGSSLGVRALYGATIGHFAALRASVPQIIFLESIESEYLARLAETFKERGARAEEVLVIVVSKSGTTTETLVNAEILLDLLGSFIPELARRTVIITDPQSPLTGASGEGYTVLNIPAAVGGRFSVFSAAGLFPLALLEPSIGNLDELILGARTLLEKELSGSGEAARAAAIRAFHYGEGKGVHDLFTFLPELEVFGAWHRQLFGESLGKTSRGGERIGIVPTVSVGSSDLHSVGQLYLGGPALRYTTFINSARASRDLCMPAQTRFTVPVELAGKTTAAVRDAIYRGVTDAYRAAGLPFAEIALDDLSLGELGALMQFEMLEVIYSGALLGVNVFDQPAVEGYKQRTRAYLAQ